MVVPMRLAARIRVTGFAALCVCVMVRGTTSKSPARSHFYRDSFRTFCEIIFPHGGMPLSLSGDAIGTLPASGWAATPLDLVLRYLVEDFILCLLGDL